MYEAQLAIIKDLRPPTRVLGIHKKLEKAYSQYVLACQSMVESITDESVDVNQFNESETKQDARNGYDCFLYSTHDAITFKITLVFLLDNSCEAVYDVCITNNNLFIFHFTLILKSKILLSTADMISSGFLCYDKIS